MSTTEHSPVAPSIKAGMDAVRRAERQAEANTVQPLQDDVEFCPTCQRPFAHKANRFSTGQLPGGVIEADGPLDPEGETGYRVIQRLAMGEEPEAIALNMALTVGQVEGMARHLNRAQNVTIGVHRKMVRGEAI